ncbi:MAG TPA: thioesterase family protein [Acidobacteriaceae bacterium]|jgi:acyl-CoA thioesterase FadM|nr:thioesterase family protein [Acidobacteriaceae bacterium]
MAHYNSFIRIPALVLRQRFRPLPRLGMLESDRIHLRVWPTDIDFNFHLNNSRFLSYMDYSRVRLAARLGVLDIAMQQRWMPLLGAVHITYRRSLELWAPFTLTTRMLGWDEKWFFMEHVFQGASGVAAIAWVHGLFRDSQGNIPPQKIVDMVAAGMASPPLPESVRVAQAVTRDTLASYPRQPEQKP